MVYSSDTMADPIEDKKVCAELVDTETLAAQLKCEYPTPSEIQYFIAAQLVILNCKTQEVIDKP